MINKGMAWKALQKHFEKLAGRSILSLFNENHKRFEEYSIKFDDLLFDFSKNNIDDETLALLINLANEAGLKGKIKAMFSGEKINITEQRAVLHTALRNFSDESLVLDGDNIMLDIRRVQKQMKDFCEKVHLGAFKGYNGDRIKNIVNIGIGGSDLGPAMVCEAMKPYAFSDMSVYFVSNVDATHIAETLKYLNPEDTIFIIASKTFTTQETITNANTAKSWFIEKSGDESAVSQHFIALSTNEEAVTEFGINKEYMFEFWDWVGGRYSLWSAIGLSIALYIGYDNFERLLRGAHKIDIHFLNTPFERNIPVIMGLIGIWYNNFFGYNSYAIIPYEQYLCKLPDFLQQLDMESNGKSITLNAENVEYHTGPVIWGSAGTNSQHSFFQLLHQGTHAIPADFIAAIHSHNDLGEHHYILLSNFLAQTEALMKGKTNVEAATEIRETNTPDYLIELITKNKSFTGNKPSNTILIDKLTPETLGMLIALYEHKVFVQGVIWELNSFDQWGVELGKKLAKTILNELNDTNMADTHDSSTNGLINYIKYSRTNN